MNSNHNWLGAMVFLIFWMVMVSLSAGHPDDIDTEILISEDLKEAVAQAQAGDKKNDFSN